MSQSYDYRGATQINYSGVINFAAIPKAIVSSEQADAWDRASRRQI